MVCTAISNDFPTTSASMPKLQFPDAGQFDYHSAPRHWLPTPEQLVEACADCIDAGRPEGLEELTTHFGAPATDLTVTPLTARATLMAADYGRAFYHHELRRRLAMPEPLEPEIDVWEGGTVPAWADGVLVEPKYFSFFQDAPLPAYNPNHRRKWRAHELLHGASRFFWHPELTRFEFYVSARLNELLPVVHWYHLDEVFRPRCPDHEDQVLHRDHCLECQEVARPYWQCDATTADHRVEAAHQLVTRGWDHFEEEWEAIGAEIETGRRHQTPRRRLDASSDAVGYMRAHWNRVTAWSFGSWVELFLEDGVDYFSDLHALRENVGRSLHQLVSGSVDVTVEHYLARRTRSQLQDLGYRVLLALEWLDPDSDDARRAEEMLMPELEASARVAAELLDDESRVEEGLDQFARTCQVFSQVAPRFPEEIADGFLGFGYRFIDPEVFATAGVGQLWAGIEDALPQTADNLDQPVETIRRFSLSPHFDELGRLGGRFSRWLIDEQHSDSGDESQAPGPSERLVEMARFEAFANAEPRRDQEAVHFAALPARAGELRTRPGRLRAHRTLRRREFRADVVADLTGESLENAESVAVAASLVDGNLRMVIEDEDVTTVLDNVEQRRPVDEWWEFRLSDAVMLLLENSLITWLPAPR